MGPLSRHPGRVAVAGALTIAFSAILVRKANVAPATAAVFRCAYAVPPLGVLAWMERRRFGPRTGRELKLSIWAGAFFAADLICWHYAIHDVGAGLATVLGNLQVVLVGVVAWLTLGEKPEARVIAAVPIALFGIVLISGVLGHGAYGEDPLRGVVFGVATGLTYAGFILVLRQSGRDLRRPVAPLFEATTAAAVFALIGGLVIGDIDLTPSWPAHGWLVLLALSSQVVGWLLISLSLPRLPAALTSVLLTVQPVGSVTLGVILLSESPSLLQLVGVACIFSGIVVATTRKSRVPA
ncbi:MAG TPA: DMT family transporter [Thermoleophilaceae bacterium]